MEKKMSFEQKLALFCIGLGVGFGLLASLLLGVTLGCKMGIMQYSDLTELSMILMASDYCTADVFLNFPHIVGLGIW